jgi:hypothetical protein
LEEENLEFSNFVKVNEVPEKKRRATFNVKSDQRSYQINVKEFIILRY